MSYELWVMRINDLRQFKRILILGYGKEGQATEKFLKKFVPKAKIGISDQKDGQDYLKKQKEYDLVIKTPGIPKNWVTIPYTTATNIFFGNCPGQIIGITGSKGKTTTSSLIFSILKQAGKKVHLIGNIGQPMLSELNLNGAKDEIFICELSSYQLDDIKYSPHYSVVTSLFPEHMNYHGDIDSYFEAKKNIIKFAKREDYYIFNPRYERLCQWSREFVGQSVAYENTFQIRDGDTQLRGEHNKDNIKAAITIGHLFGISDTILKEVIKNFQPIRHRLQFVAKVQGIEFYDDAISTAPESTIFAINSFPVVGTIFLGGEDRGYDFTALVKLLKTKKIPNVVLFPESGEKIKKLLKEIDYSPQIFETQSMEGAVNFAYAHTPLNTVCLLSTASPSYSLWKNFEEKGDQFQFYVKQSN